MSAISRKSLTPLRSCCKTSSEKIRAPAAWCMASQAFRSALRSSWKSFSRWRNKREVRDAGTHCCATPRLPHGVDGFCDARIISIAGPGPGKGTARGTPDFLSHDTDRWALHLLQRGRPERRADASPAARTSLFIADVRASLRPAFRSLSPCRARLPGLRTQRLAGPEAVRLYLRPHRFRDRLFHASDEFVALHAVHAGLWWAGWLSRGIGTPGAGASAH